MKFFLAAALAVIASTLVPGNVSARSNDVNLQRIETLEKENAALRERVRQLEAKKTVVVRAAPAAPVPSAATYAIATKAPVAPAPLPFNWTGFYIGGHAGYGWQQIITPPSPGQTPPPKPNGGFWGGQVGVNYQFASNWVVGVEFNDSVARIENTVLQPDPLAPTTLLAFTGKTNSQMVLLARLGFVSDRNLFYVSGGPAWIRSQINSANGGNFVGSPGIVIDHETERGWAVGGGFETVLWSNWTGRIQYQYIHSNPFTVISLGGPSPGIRTDLQSVMVGVNYLFH